MDKITFYFEIRNFMIFSKETKSIYNIENSLLSLLVEPERGSLFQNIS
jgi:hypothetical protein